MLDVAYPSNFLYLWYNSKNGSKSKRKLLVFRRIATVEQLQLKTQTDTQDIHTQHTHTVSFTVFLIHLDAYITHPTQMLNFDLLGNGENPSRVKQESIHQALSGVIGPQQEFVDMCLRQNKEERPSATTLLKHPALQEVGDCVFTSIVLGM